jgi:hypothetical protein
MTRTVVVQETALRALARIRSEDKAAFAAIRRALVAPEQGVGKQRRGCRMDGPGRRRITAAKHMDTGRASG